MTQLEKLIKQYDIYITYLDFRFPNFRCQFVIPTLEICCAVEAKSLRQLHNRMTERIEENLKICE